MTSGDDWDTTSFEGNRRRQREQFRALPFREKVAAIEHMNEVAAFLIDRWKARTGGSNQSDPGNER